MHFQTSNFQTRQPVHSRGAVIHIGEDAEQHQTSASFRFRRVLDETDGWMDGWCQFCQFNLFQPPINADPSPFSTAASIIERSAMYVCRLIYLKSALLMLSIVLYKYCHRVVLSYHIYSYMKETPVTTREGEQH